MASLSISTWKLHMSLYSYNTLYFFTYTKQYEVKSYYTQCFCLQVIFFSQLTCLIVNAKQKENKND